MNKIQRLRKQIMSSLRQGASRLISTQSCFLCGASTTEPCCPACLAALPRLEGALCYACAHPLRQGHCPACRIHPFRPHHTLAAFAYAAPTTHLLHRFKYAGRAELAQWLAEQMWAPLQTWHQQSPIDALIALPLHPLRQADRGYNQAHELTRHLSRKLHRPCLTEHCHRLKATPPQVELGLAQRRALPADLFACDVDLAGQHVLLVDDVLTTGSSLNALTQAVLRQGARQVSAAVLARALLPDGDVFVNPCSVPA